MFFDPFSVLIPIGISILAILALSCVGMLFILAVRCFWMGVALSFFSLSFLSGATLKCVRCANNAMCLSFLSVRPVCSAAPVALPDVLAFRSHWFYLRWFGPLSQSMPMIVVMLGVCIFIF